MARLRDVPNVLKTCGTWAFLKRIAQQVSEDGIFIWASALAYSWLFAVFPFLIFLLTLVPYLPQKLRDSANSEIKTFTTKTLGSAAETINDNIGQVISRPRHGWLGFGLIVSLWAASGGFSMTMSALDRCYDIKKGRPFYRQRSLAIILTVFVILIAFVVVILMPVGTAAEHFLEGSNAISDPLRWTFDLARYGLALFFMFSVLAIIYHFGPSITHRFEAISPGAVFSVVVWFLLDFGFRYYVGKFARYDQTYGTVGGAAILLLFFYIDALVLLIGAEINSEIDFEVLGVPPGERDFKRQRKNELAPLPNPPVDTPNIVKEL